MRFLLLAAEGFPSTVYASQVGDLLRVLDRAGLRFDLLNYDPLYPRTLASRAGRARVAELAAAVPGALSVRPYVPFEDRLGVPFARRLLARQLGDGPAVVHARGVWAALMAVRVAARRPALRVVYDARGDYLAEHAMHATGRGDAGGRRVRLAQRRIGRAEAEVCRGADRVLAVSDALAAVLERRSPGVAARTLVVPCGYDPEKFVADPALRAGVRARLGLSDRFVIAYAGSLVPYQLPGALARAGRLACALRPDAHLLLLTPDVARARRLLVAEGVAPARFTCLAAPHADVPGYLNAADLGLLLRRDDPVNRVASPTKLAEYLACGVPVLGSAAVEDYARLIRTEGLGGVVEDPEDEVALRAALAELLSGPLPPRERVAAVARDRLARDRFVGVYRDLYGALAAEAQAAARR